MRRRTFEEMITYFNQTVSEMDIDQKYKMTLLGIVTALLQKHDEDVAQIVRCKDCKHQEKFFHEDKRRKEGGYYIFGCELADGYSHVCLDEDFCSRAERKDGGTG
jgi:hypothetical protein